MRNNNKLEIVASKALEIEIDFIEANHDFSYILVVV